MKLWEGIVSSSGNSQHLSDWYTFSHIIHGFLFYGLLRILFPRMPIGLRFSLAVGAEVGWEILENTSIVIRHYRQQALAHGYTGDSILNSLSDCCAMALGFVAAWRLPVWSILALAIALEAFAGIMIRDNLTLNVLNLIHRFPIIQQWQTGHWATLTTLAGLG